MQNFINYSVSWERGVSILCHLLFQACYHLLYQFIFSTSLVWYESHHFLFPFLWRIFLQLLRWWWIMLCFLLFSRLKGMNNRDRWRQQKKKRETPQENLSSQKCFKWKLEIIRKETKNAIKMKTMSWNFVSILKTLLIQNSITCFDSGTFFLSSVRGKRRRRCFRFFYKKKLGNEMKNWITRKETSRLMKPSAFANLIKKKVPKSQADKKFQPFFLSHFFTEK